MKRPSNTIGAANRAPSPGRPWTIMSCLLSILVFLSLSWISWAEKPGKPSAKANAGQGYKILVVHSYHPEMPWVQECTRGITVTLSQSAIGAATTIRHFYLDTKRSPEKVQEKARLAYELYRRWRPDLVMACDDNAQRFFVVPYLRGKTNTPVVFLGVNADPETYGYPASNVTGVLERNHIALTIKLLKRLCPSIETLAVINDASPTGLILTKRIRQALEGTDIEVVGYYNTNSFSRWKELIEEFQTKADSIYTITYFTLRDEAGEHVPILEALKWLIANSRLPDATNSKDSVKNGILCSVAIDGFIHGGDAAHMAIEILEGTPVGKIPIKRTTRGARVINRSRARALGVTIPTYLMEGTAFYDSPFINSSNGPAHPAQEHEFGHQHLIEPAGPR